MNVSKQLASLPPRTLALMVFSSIFVGALVSMSVLYHEAVTHKEEALRRHVRDLVVAAAGLVNVPVHEQLTQPQDLHSANYRRALAPLLKLHRGHPSIQYIWTVRVTAADEQLVVLETSVDDEVRREQLALGRSQDILDFLGPNTETERGRESLPILRAGQPWVFPGIYEDEHGSYIEARAPLNDETGRFIGYVGVDYALDSFHRQINEVRLAGGASLLLALVLSAILARTSYYMREQGVINLRRAEEQRDRADRALREKGELLAIASHDLKNPLSSIAGLSGILLRVRRSDPAASPDDVEALESINSAARHMGEIVRGILVNEGVEQGGLQLQAAPCDLVALGEEVRRFNAAAAARKQITLDYRHPAALTAHVDAKLLREAVDNYLSNAVKYSARGSRVTLELVAPAGGGWEFAVVDEGPGLSEADQVHLFEKFRRLTPRPTGNETSTGLGLSIVKAIAELHGGTVGCVTELGRGSRFWLRGPAATT